MHEKLTMCVACKVSSLRSAFTLPALPASLPPDSNPAVCKITTTKSSASRLDASIVTSGVENPRKCDQNSN